MESCETPLLSLPPLCTPPSRHRWGGLLFRPSCWVLVSPFTPITSSACRRHCVTSQQHRKGDGCAVRCSEKEIIFRIAFLKNCTCMSALHLCAPFRPNFLIPPFQIFLCKSKEWSETKTFQASFFFFFFLQTYQLP